MLWEFLGAASMLTSPELKLSMAYWDLVRPLLDCLKSWPYSLSVPSEELVKVWTTCSSAWTFFCLFFYFLSFSAWAWCSLRSLLSCSTLTLETPLTPWDYKLESKLLSSSYSTYLRGPLVFFFPVNLFQIASHISFTNMTIKKKHKRSITPKTVYVKLFTLGFYQKLYSPWAVSLLGFTTTCPRCSEAYVLVSALSWVQTSSVTFKP